MERIRKAIDWLKSAYWVWTVLFPSIAAALATGMIAAAADWLNRYGAVAWWGASLLALCSLCLVGSLLIIAVAYFRERTARQAAIKKWSEKVTSFNPAAPEFNGQRIYIEDLVNPVTGFIENKTITNCELFGPANLYLLNHFKFGVNELFETDVIAIRPDVPVFNAIGLLNVKILNCKFYKCSLLVAPQYLDMVMNQMRGSISISKTGINEYDSRVPPKAPL
jgi:hypothetical protein